MVVVPHVFVVGLRQVNTGLKTKLTYVYNQNVANMSRSAHPIEKNISSDTGESPANVKVIKISSLYRGFAFRKVCIDTDQSNIIK